MKTEKRVESDSIGSMNVPAAAYYGVQSLRAMYNFPITGMPLNPAFITSLACIKKAAAYANEESGVLSAEKTAAIVQACDEVTAGSFRGEFIVDAIQGGAGTSANMNINEVIANRADELMGGKRGSYTFIHPNDDVNKSQSTNDVVPTAGKLTALSMLVPLEAELLRLENALAAKAAEFSGIVKMARTQLQDAVPMTLGQSFGAYRSMVRRCRKQIGNVKPELYQVNLGGTAIGSTLNAPETYERRVVPILARITGFPLVQADDLFDATQHIDSFASVSSVLKVCALDLSKMCNDLRLLSSGPRAGFNEIHLPAMQNGSSIMPGKVNPVIPEVVSQVAFSVAGNDAAICMAVEAGQMELNAFEPVVFYKLFESITTLTGAVRTLTDNCITGITVNGKQCSTFVERSVGTATALCPYIGYKKSAEIAKRALAENVSVREIVLREHLIQEAQLDRILDPLAMVQSSAVHGEECVKTA